MHRGENIIFKLQHIHNLQQNLLDLIHSKGIIQDKIVSISDKIGDILGNSHECFDYCAKDLTKIIEPEFNKDVYFPFSKIALKKNHSKIMLIMKLLFS
jgi:hypothetical protein